MTFCFVGIGSNEDPEYHCQQMIAALRERFGKVWVSSLKKTPAYGVEAADYINGVVCFEANIDAVALKEWCRKLESSLGRVRGKAHCVADLDILFTANIFPSLRALPDVESYYQQSLEQVAKLVSSSLTENI